MHHGNSISPLPAGCIVINLPLMWSVVFKLRRTSEAEDPTTAGGWGMGWWLHTRPSPAVILRPGWNSHFEQVQGLSSPKVEGPSGGRAISGSMAWAGLCSMQLTILVWCFTGGRCLQDSQDSWVGVACSR